MPPRRVRLLPCPWCARHVFARESSCPFCLGVLSIAAAALGTSFALAGCGDRTGLDARELDDASSDAARDGTAAARDAGDASTGGELDATFAFDTNPPSFDAGADVDSGGPMPVYGAPPPPGSPRIPRTGDP